MSDPGGLLVAATPIDPPVDGKVWAFHLVNGLPDAIESGVVLGVDYEWGDMGNGVAPDLAFGRIEPGGSLEVWRDDDNAAELRTSLVILLRGPWGERKITAEFGKLYLVKDPGPVPILGRPGRVGHVMIWPNPPGTIEIDGSGVRSWLEGGKLEAVRWDSLVKVEILTTDEGPLVDDVIWLLYGSDGKGCAVGSEQDPPGALLRRLQQLPGFDNAAVIKAMGTASKARFLAWEKK